MSCSRIQSNNTKNINIQKEFKNSNFKPDEASHKLTAENFRKRFSDIRVSSPSQNASAASSQTNTPKQPLKVYRRIETAILEKDAHITEILRQILLSILEAIYKGLLHSLKGIICILKTFWICIKYVLAGFGLISKILLRVLYYTSKISLIMCAQMVEWKSRAFPSQNTPIQRITENGNYRKLYKLNRTLENKVVKKNSTLVLDLDETLVHVSTIKPNSKYETIEVYEGF